MVSCQHTTTTTTATSAGRGRNPRGAGRERIRGGRSDPVQQRFHHGPGHLVVDRRSRDQEPVEQRRGQQVQRELHVRVGAQLAALEKKYSDVAMLISALDPRVARLRIGLVLGRDGGVLRERLLEAETSDEKLQAVEAALLEHLARPSEADPAVAFAAAAFGAASPCPT